MNKYRFHWLHDGETNDGEGSSPEDAFSKLGFGQGAIPALDYWEKLSPDDEFDSETDAE